MMQPIGSRGSPNHQSVVLTNWARLRGVNIGSFGWRGKSLSVQHQLGTTAFVVDARGQDHPIVHAAIPYRCRRERQQAFRVALRIFEAA